MGSHWRVSSRGGTGSSLFSRLSLKHVESAVLGAKEKTDMQEAIAACRWENGAGSPPVVAAETKASTDAGAHFRNKVDEPC